MTDEERQRFARRLRERDAEIEARKTAAEKVYLEQVAEIERLTAALQLSQSQNYCTLCGAALEPKP